MPPLSRVKDWWNSWWSFLSGATLAIYGVVSYFSDAKVELFIFARLFRWELLCTFVILLAISLARLPLWPMGPWWPSNLTMQAYSAMCNVAKRGTPVAERIAGALVGVTGLVFIAVSGLHLIHAYQFLNTRYAHIERQSLVAEAGKVEVAQDLPRAAALYKNIVERFPYSIYNSDALAKADKLIARQRDWEQARSVVMENSSLGMASTKFDQLLETCRYISNIAPCTDIEAYLVPVEGAIELAQRNGESCFSVVKRTPTDSLWLFMDANDRSWLGLKETDAAELCIVLGLHSGKELADYLDQRWRVSKIRAWQRLSPFDSHIVLIEWEY